MRFRTTIQQSGKTATGIQVPDEVVEALGSGRRPAVKVTINGYTYRCWKADFRHAVFLDPDPVTSTSCYNLVPILAHELGHAFGLPDTVTT